MRLELNQDQIAIINLIKAYPDSLGNQRRFASILSDCIPQNKALRTALVNAYEEGVIEAIQTGENPQQTIFQCRKRLENNCGIAASYAQSAVLIMTYLCGKESWFESKEVKVDSTTKIEIDRERRHEIFSVGEIEYTLSDNCAIITNVDFKRGDLRQTKTVIVIPERLGGYDVGGIMPNAFNLIRKEKCKMVILPATVKFVGTDYYKFYSEFKEKGVYVKPLLYLAKSHYESYSDFTVFYEKLTEINQEEFFAFEVNQETVEGADFILLKKYQDENDYWKYPSDGQWISVGQLDKYTGNDSKVVITDCLGVSTDAFVGLNIEEIVFGANVRIFSSNMIHDCNCLRKIEFESVERCSIESGAIHHCEELSQIDWPHNMNFEQISIYNHCPKLGNMVVYRRLLTCQSKDIIYEVESDLVRINNRAFTSCESLKVVVVPKEMEVIEENAFADSDITFIIVRGVYTQWKVNAHNGKHIYVYAYEESNVKSAVSPYNPQPLVHMKNINSLEAFLESNDKEKIVEYCLGHMDKKSDDEMVVKPYSWSREIHEKGWG